MFSLKRAPEALGNVERISQGTIDLNSSGEQLPSIRDYYVSMSQNDKPITYQHGLANYSSVQLGDDRVNYQRSMSQEIFQLDTERRERMEKGDQLAKIVQTREQMVEAYQEAVEIVGEEGVVSMEVMMRDKLQQRTSGGPFHLRKTFKYFDRDGSGGIDEMEFGKALELMGFIFNEHQVRALFARYDNTYDGEIDYAEFIGKLMEADFTSVSKVSATNLNKMFNKTFGGKEEEDDDDNAARAFDLDGDGVVDEEERKLELEEVERVFRMIDKDGNGYIAREELELIGLALGHRFSKEELDRGYEHLDADNSGTLDFEEFLEWWDMLKRGETF